MYTDRRLGVQVASKENEKERERIEKMIVEKLKKGHDTEEKGRIRFLHVLFSI